MDEHLDGRSSRCVSSFGLLSTSLESNAFTRSATNKFRTWKMEEKHSNFSDTYQTTHATWLVDR